MPKPSQCWCGRRHIKMKEPTEKQVNRINLTDYEYPDPPVSTHMWSEYDWKKWAFLHGRFVGKVEYKGEVQ